MSYSLAQFWTRPNIFVFAINNSCASTGDEPTTKSILHLWLHAPASVQPELCAGGHEKESTEHYSDGW